MNRGLNVLIIVVTSLAVPLVAHAQSWSAAFGAPPQGNGLNEGANALLVYQNRLIAAGDFTQAGSVAVNRMAAWNGAQWSALGNGPVTTGHVWALAEYDGDLIAAGGTGSPSGGFLRRWDGSVWSMIPSPPGTTATFWSVYSHEGMLFVGSRENGVSKLAWWDGANWSSLAMPPDPLITGSEIAAMVLDNGLLFMTGSAWGSGGYHGFLFSWNGEEFGGPGYVINGDGFALHVYHELLYVGGDWSPQPPITNDGIAIWNGSTWTPFGANPPFVNAIETYHGRIVLGGSGVTSFNGIAYNGQNEQFLGGGCTSTMWVFAVKEFQGDLYVTGLFDEICTDNDVIQSSNIASWSEPVTAVSNSPTPGGNLRIESAPNPFNPSVTLSIHVPVKSEVSVTICDATGRVVRRVASGVQNPGPYRVMWNGAGDGGERLASGVYFARVTAGKSTATAKLVLLK